MVLSGVGGFGIGIWDGRGKGSGRGVEGVGRWRIGRGRWFGRPWMRGRIRVIGRMVCVGFEIVFGRKE